MEEMQRARYGGRGWSFHALPRPPSPWIFTGITNLEGLQTPSFWGFMKASLQDWWNHQHWGLIPPPVLLPLWRSGGRTKSSKSHFVTTDSGVVESSSLWIPTLSGTGMRTKYIFLITSHSVTEQLLLEHRGFLADCALCSELTWWTTSSSVRFSFVLFIVWNVLGVSLWLIFNSSELLLRYL